MCAHLNNEAHTKQRSTSQSNKVSLSNNIQAHNLSSIKVKQITHDPNEKSKVIRTQTQ